MLFPPFSCYSSDVNHAAVAVREMFYHGRFDANCFCLGNCCLALIECHSCCKPSQFRPDRPTQRCKQITNITRNRVMEVNRASKRV